MHIPALSLLGESLMWARHVACTGETRTSLKILLAKREMKCSEVLSRLQESAEVAVQDTCPRPT